MGVFPDMLKDDKYGNIRIIILLGIPESMEDDTVLVRLYDDIFVDWQETGCHSKDPENGKLQRISSLYCRRK